MQSALGYIPLHPPPPEVGTLCTPEMAALTWQHVSHPPVLEGGMLHIPDMAALTRQHVSRNAVHTRHGSPDPATCLPTPQCWRVKCCAYQTQQL